MSTTDFVSVAHNGQFHVGGKRWFCNSVVYFGKYPGTMRDWLADPWWKRNEPRLEADFDRIGQFGLNHAALFLTSSSFFDRGEPVAQGYDRLVAQSDGVRLHSDAEV